MDIKEYTFEIHHIMQELDNLVNERYYEQRGGSAKASTIARGIQHTFSEFIKRLANDEPSVLNQYSINAKDKDSSNE